MTANLTDQAAGICTHLVIRLARFMNDSGEQLQEYRCDNCDRVATVEINETITEPAPTGAESDATDVSL